MNRAAAGFIRVMGLTVLALLMPSPAWAEVVRIEVDSRVELADGAAWGPAGAYERIMSAVSGAWPKKIYRRSWLNTDAGDKTTWLSIL